MSDATTSAPDGAAEGAQREATRGAVRHLIASVTQAEKHVQCGHGTLSVCRLSFIQVKP